MSRSNNDWLDYVAARREEDYLMHKNGFKYVDKKFINGRWEYIYPDDLLNATKQKAMNKVGDIGNRVGMTANNVKNAVNVGLNTADASYRTRDKANRMLGRQSTGETRINALKDGYNAGKLAYKGSKFMSDTATALRKKDRAAASSPKSSIKPGLDERLGANMPAGVTERVNGVKKNVNNVKNAINVGRKTADASYKTRDTANHLLGRKSTMDTRINAIKDGYKAGKLTYQGEKAIDNGSKKARETVDNGTQRVGEALDRTKKQLKNIDSSDVKRELSRQSKSLGLAQQSAAGRTSAESSAAQKQSINNRNKSAVKDAKRMANNAVNGAKKGIKDAGTQLKNNVINDDNKRTVKSIQNAYNKSGIKEAVDNGRKKANDLVSNTKSGVQKLENQVNKKTSGGAQKAKNAGEQLKKTGNQKKAEYNKALGEQKSALQKELRDAKDAMNAKKADAKKSLYNIGGTIKNKATAANAQRIVDQASGAVRNEEALKRVANANEKAMKTYNETVKSVNKKMNELSKKKKKNMRQN